MAVSENDLVVGPLTPAQGVSVISLDFYVEKKEWLAVYKNDGSAPMAQGADYTFTGEGTKTGVVSLTEAANGQDIYSVYLEVPLERGTDFQLRGALRSGPLNAECDRIWQALQRHETLLKRTIRVGHSSSSVNALAAASGEVFLRRSSDGTFRLDPYTAHGVSALEGAVVYETSDAQALKADASLGYASSATQTVAAGDLIRSTDGHLWIVKAEGETACDCPAGDGWPVSLDVVPGPTGFVSSEAFGGIADSDETGSTGTDNALVFQRIEEGIARRSDVSLVMQPGWMRSTRIMDARSTTLKTAYIFAYGCRIVFTHASAALNRIHFSVSNTALSGTQCVIAGLFTDINRNPIRSGGCDMQQVAGFERMIIRDPHIPSADNMAVTIGRVGDDFKPRYCEVSGHTIGGKNPVSGSTHDYGSIGDTGVWIVTPGDFSIIRDGSVKGTGDDAYAIVHPTDGQERHAHFKDLRAHSVGSSAYKSSISDTFISNCDAYLTRNSFLHFINSNSGGSASVSGVTLANPGVVTTSGNHGFTTGDNIRLSGIGGTTELNDNTYDITVISDTAFQLTGTDTTSFTAYTTGGAASLDSSKNTMPARMIASDCRGRKIGHATAANLNVDNLVPGNVPSAVTVEDTLGGVLVHNCSLEGVHGSVIKVFTYNDSCSDITFRDNYVRDWGQDDAGAPTNEAFFDRARSENDFSLRRVRIEGNEIRGGTGKAPLISWLNESTSRDGDLIWRGNRIVNHTSTGSGSDALFTFNRLSTGNITNVSIEGDVWDNVTISGLTMILRLVGSLGLSNFSAWWQDVDGSRTDLPVGMSRAFTSYNAVPLKVPGGRGQTRSVQQTIVGTRELGSNILARLDGAYGWRVLAVEEKSSAPGGIYHGAITPIFKQEIVMQSVAASSDCELELVRVADAEFPGGQGVHLRGKTTGWSGDPSIRFALIVCERIERDTTITNKVQ